MSNGIVYTPPTTIRTFMEDDRRIRMVRGPVGSGKSSGMVMELLRRANMQEPDPKDGIRRTRGVVVRNTLPQLKTTCLKTMNELIGPLIEWRETDKTARIRYGNVETEWILMPLDTPENIQRLLSLDITFGWISEFREVNPEIVMAVYSRCGRYPSMMHGGPSWHGIIAETNSFDEDSPWNKILEEKELDGKPLPDSWGYFIQPGAREASAENKENLVAGYYEDLIENNSPSWVEQYIDNKIAPSLSGEAVFRESFKQQFHVSGNIILPIPGVMLLIGMDFGRNPAAVLSQMDARGRIAVLGEVVGENVGVEQFVMTQLRPFLAQPQYRHLPVGVCGDPSGIARGQIGEESVFNALKRMGLSAQPAQTNDIEPRLRAVEKWLLQQRDGGPALIISPTCDTLIKALRSKYRFARKKDGELHPVPEKTHPWSDIADAFQYCVLGYSGNIMARLVRVRRDHKKSPPVSSGGWT